MLSKITLENFKSIKNKTTIDFNSTGYEILNDTNKTNDNILKGALFIGGNASGKSNVLASMIFLLDLLVFNKPIDFINYTCLFSPNDTKINYEFKVLSSIINYEITITRKENGILSEKVFIDNKEVINRVKSSGSYILPESNIVTENLPSTQSYVRRAYFDTHFTDNDVLAYWYNKLEKSLYVLQDAKTIMGYAANEIISFKYYENQGTEKVNNFLNEIGYNQKLLYTSKYKGENVGFNFGDKKVLFFQKKNIDFALPYALESTGNNAIAILAPYMLDAIENDAILIIDEFESGFHNELEECFIRYFMKHSKRAQLFVVSHSTNLLKTNLLRPDQIYTTDFTNEGTVLTRVSDLKPRESQNMEKMYLSGVFDGLPKLK